MPRGKNSLKRGVDAIDHTYVDDVAASKSDTSEVNEITKSIDTILNQGKFSIKVWHSNHTDADQGPGENPINLLGHQWDKREDALALKKNEVSSDLDLCTKRNILSLVSKIWDPMGIVTAVPIQFRIDLQKLWAAGYGWDDLLPPEQQVRWRQNCMMMNVALNINLNRCLRPEGAVRPPQLHGFCDGGELGCGAAVFLRWEVGDNFACTFVAAKPLVAPLKK